MNIKSFTLENVYENPEQFVLSLKNLDWILGQSGEELPDFQSLPEELKYMLNSFSPGISVDEENSGSFRKPFNTIHFEDFFDNTAMVGILALEPCKIEFLKYIGNLEMKGNPGSVYGINFEIQDLIGEYILSEKWEVHETQEVKAGEVFFFTPDKFHRIEGSPVTQMFFMNRRTVKTPDVIID